MSGSHKDPSIECLQEWQVWIRRRASGSPMWTKTLWSHIGDDVILFDVVQ